MVNQATGSFSVFLGEKFRHSATQNKGLRLLQSILWGKNPPNLPHFQDFFLLSCPYLDYQVLASRQYIMGFQKNSSRLSDAQPDFAKSSCGGSPVHLPHELFFEKNVTGTQWESVPCPPIGHPSWCVLPACWIIMEQVTGTRMRVTLDSQGANHDKSGTQGGYYTNLQKHRAQGLWDIKEGEFQPISNQECAKHIRELQKSQNEMANIYI